MKSQYLHYCVNNLTQTTKCKLNNNIDCKCLFQKTIKSNNLIKSGRQPYQKSTKNNHHIKSLSLQA